MSLFKFNDTNTAIVGGTAAAFKSIAAANAIDLSNLKEIDELLPSIDNSANAFFISDKRWSAHQMIAAYLTQMTWADVWLTTYGINEHTMRQIANRKQAGQIRELYFMFSEQVKKIKPQEIQIAMQIATAYCVYPSHAKIIVLKNDTHQVLIVSSMNLNRNNKLEAGAITTDVQAVQLFIDFLNDKICTPKNN
jgi:hypothetical protein